MLLRIKIMYTHKCKTGISGDSWFYFLPDIVRDHTIIYTNTAEVIMPRRLITVSSARLSYSDASAVSTAGMHDGYQNSSTVKSDDE